MTAVLVLIFFKKALTLKKSRFWKILKSAEKGWKKLWKIAETILPFGCCPLAFL